MAGLRIDFGQTRHSVLRAYSSSKYSARVTVLGHDICDYCIQSIVAAANTGVELDPNLLPDVSTMLGHADVKTTQRY
jgi:hypothetical protein